MTEVSSVEEELVKTTKIKRKKGEKDQAFYKRLMDKMEKVGDDVWDTLSDETQIWCNDAADALSKKKAIPAFPEPEDDEEEEESDEEEEDDDSSEESDDNGDGEDSEDEDEDEGDDDDDDDEEEEEKPKKTARKSSSSKDKKDSGKKKSSEKKSSASEAKSEKRPRGGVTGAIRNTILKNPGISVEDLTEKLDALGFGSASITTITTVRSDFRVILQMMDEGGYLSDTISKKWKKVKAASTTKKK